MAELLVVDDNVDNVEALAELLREEGHVVRTAGSGVEGLQKLQGRALPDAIILDVEMPFLSGPGMAHQMLLHDAGEEKIPILLMSARDDLADIALAMGTPYFLVKGVGIESIYRVLNAALTERSAPTSA